MIDWDFAGLSDEEIQAYLRAINGGNDLRRQFGESSLDFIVRNYVKLAQIGELEKSWLSSYVFTSRFQDVGFDKLKAIFDACDRSRLQAHHLCVPADEGISTERISLLRGCAGPVHTPGMSWTTSLDKAIFYAAWHASIPLERGLSTDLAVYATTVDLGEIYCRMKRNEDEFIVVPDNLWRIDIPVAEFRLDRPRY
jgi:hypothetical protein